MPRSKSITGFWKQLDAFGEDDRSLEGCSVQRCGYSLWFRRSLCCRLQKSGWLYQGNTIPRLALLVTVTLWFLCQVHLWPHSLQLSLCITSVQPAANVQCKCNYFFSLSFHIYFFSLSFSFLFLFSPLPPQFLWFSTEKAVALLILKGRISQAD